MNEDYTIGRDVQQLRHDVNVLQQKLSEVIEYLNVQPKADKIPTGSETRR